MKTKIGLIISCVLILLAVGHFTANTDESKVAETNHDYVTVIRVSDGDTFWIMNANGEKEKIRLIGIDAPESVASDRKEIGHFGKESSDYLKNLLRKKRVRLEYDVQQKDQYGRTLAYAYLEDSTFLNDYLLRNGYAVVFRFPPNVKYANQFKKSERYARQNNLGLWKK